MRHPRIKEKIIITCQTCGKDFPVNTCEVRKAQAQGKRRAFCSRACYGKATSVRQRGKNNPCWKDNEKPCKFCRKIFKPKPRNTKYCSQKCMGQEKHFRLSVKKNCFACSREITVIMALVKERNFCDKNCANKGHSEKMKKDGNPAWLGGIKNLPWPYEFNKELKDQIKERDGFQCFLCSTTQRILQIHHIDYDKRNNDLNNLMTLCSSCHCKTNYNRKEWQKKLSKLLSV